MGHKISINSNQTELCTVTDLKCDSPFEHCMLCECGKVSFLPGPCHFCGSQKRRPLLSSIQADIRSKLFHSIRFELLAFVISLGLIFLYLIYVSALGGFSTVLDDPEMTAVPRFIFLACGGLIVLSAVMQGIALFRTFRDSFGKTKSKNASVFFSLNSELPPFEIEGEVRIPWKKMVISGYKKDIKYLETMKIRLARNEDAALDSYEEVYYRALQLSYVCDTPDLAILRLACLKAIQLQPNAQTDLDQILLIIPTDAFVDGRADPNAILHCLKNYSGPVSSGVVLRLMLICSRLIAQRYHQFILDCMALCGPRYILPLMNKPGFQVLLPYFSQLQEEDPVFAAQCKWISMEASV